MPEPALAAPTPESDRILALDTARGVALLGILFVNMEFFARPFAKFIMGVPEDAAPLDHVAHYAMKVFAEGKFYPLFSMLFGMGLILQARRAAARGVPFVPLYLRRLTALLILGFIHAVFLWYGDILFVYAVAGAILLIFHKASARALLITGAAIIAGVFLLGAAFGALGVIFGGGPPGSAPPDDPAAIVTPAEPDAPGAQQPQDPATSPELLEPPAPSPDAATPTEPPGEAPPQPPAESEDAATGAPETSAPEERISPIIRLIRGFEDVRSEDDFFELWIETETDAYRNGGYLDATAFRAATWLMLLVFMSLGFGLTVVGVFFIGAGLMKADIFDAARARTLARLGSAGLIVGLPLAAFVGLAPLFLPEQFVGLLQGSLFFVAGPIVALGYLWLAAAATRALPRLAAPLRIAGRTALSVYLGETLLATALMYHWGLALFGTTTASQRIGLAVVIYAVLVVAALLWQRAFRFGPVEWLWRTVTYARAQPMRRA